MMNDDERHELEKRMQTLKALHGFHDEKHLAALFAVEKRAAQDLAEKILRRIETSK